MIIDEAAFVTDALFESLTSVLAITNGQPWLLRSASDERGFFHKIYAHQTPGWQIFKATVGDCPRITKEFRERDCRDPGCRNALPRG